MRPADVEAIINALMQVERENAALRAVIAAMPADMGGGERGLRTVGSELAAMMLRESVEAGNTIDIPSLGITITKDDLGPSPAARKGGG